MKRYYHYEVISPITDYGFDKKVGDYMTMNQINWLPPFYRKKVKWLPSPILIEL